MLGYTTQAGWNKTTLRTCKARSSCRPTARSATPTRTLRERREVKRGRELFFKTGCYGCHRMEGLSAGTLGPDLTEIGKERKVDYLWGHIVDPRDYTPTSIMPQFKLTDDDRKALVIFLKSRRGANIAESPMDVFKLQASKEAPVPESVGAAALNAPPATTPAARGAQLIQGYACLSCHKLGDRDGGISPDLSYEGLMRDEPWLMDHFHNPRSRVPDSNMPAFGLPDAEFQDMTTYLLSRNKPPAPMTPAETYKNLCARCHGDKGDGHGINSIYLDPAPRNLTNAEFMTTKPEERFLKSIHEGVPGTSMPDWGKTLSDDQIKGVFDYVWATYVREPHRQFKPRKVAEQNPVPIIARVHQARRSHLHAALHRLPRAQG